MAAKLKGRADLIVKEVCRCCCLQNGFMPWG